jgi:putative spermidine/putrescine transport system permease protein/mannopine transport system permease protein
MSGIPKQTSEKKINLGQAGGRVWTPSTGYLIILSVPVLVLVVFFIWPLIGVIIRSFTDPKLGFEHYLQIFSSSTYLKVLVYTFQVSVSVTILCLVISYPVAAVISGAKGGWLALAFAFILIPFWTSTVIRTYAWMVLFQRKGVLNGLLLNLDLIDKPLRLMHNSIGVHIGMVHVLLPFMILPLLSALRNIDPNYMKAASVLGANPVRAFLKIYLPLSMPGVSAGCALVFITALGFYITPALLGGPRNMFIAVLIEQQVSVVVNWGVATALASILLVVTVGLYLGYERVAHRMGAGGVLQ